MFSSLRGPLTLSLFLLTLAFVAVTEGVLFTQVRAAYLDAVQESLSQDCGLIANLMRRHMDQAALTASERKMLTDEMSRLSAGISGRICIVNWRGDVLEDSSFPSRARGTENYWDRREVYAALHGQETTALRGANGETSDWEHAGEPIMCVAVPMEAKGKVTGAIYGSRSLAQLQLTLFSLRARLYQAAAVSLLLALGLSLALARWLTSPLRALTRLAGRYAEGHLEERAPVHSRDEIATLARTFNQMAGSLAEQRELLLRFVSDASHELKTPVASLRSLIEALEGGAWEDPALREKFLGFLHRDLDRMEKLVTDLLTLQRLEREAGRLHLQEIELRPFLAELADEYGAELDCAPEARLRTDRDRLRQVLTNLLDNARRAARMADPPILRIRYRDGELAVEDNGVGLAPEHRERIFERFYRVDGARARDDGGSGLGLAITRGWVEAMGGRIRAESEGPGQGARLVVTFL